MKPAYLIGFALVLLILASNANPQTVPLEYESEYPEPEDMMHPNVRAFLDMIQAAEGTQGPNAYNMFFGGTLFDSYADHPRKVFSFTQTNGVTNRTTAAGAYQFLESTWDDLVNRFGFLDFSPENQDAGAIALIKQQRAFDDVVAGRFDEAVRKVSPIWASLPNATYPQHRRSAQFVRDAYASAGGTFA